MLWTSVWLLRNRLLLSLTSAGKIWRTLFKRLILWLIPVSSFQGNSYNIRKIIRHLIIFSLKTGEVPPKDLSFEEIISGHEIKFGTLGRRKSKLKLNKSLEEEKLFPKKKELEDAIEKVEAEIEKGNVLISKIKFNLIFQEIRK